MKTRAYNSLYLEDAMNNLGTMLDCAVHAAQCDLLTHGCLEYIDLDANLGVVGHSVYIGFRKGRLDLDKINGKSTESAKEKERNTQLREAIYDIIITDDEPYHSDGIVRNNI